MKTSTGNKKNQIAFDILQMWKTQGAPEYITSYEAFNLTNGVIGKKLSATPMRLIDVAVKYAKVGA